MNDTTNPARRLRHGDRPTAPLRWNDRWTLLLTGPHHGMIGPLGSTWPNQSAEYERVDVCVLREDFPVAVFRRGGEGAGSWHKLELISHGAPTDPLRDGEQLYRAGTVPKLESIEQYRMQMAAIGTASFGYWKEGDTIHPDYDTVPLRDVARLYAKYEALHKAQPSDAARDVIAERRRQVEQEGYEHEHDDAHPGGEIAAYAAFYAMPPAARDWPATETGYGETFGEAIVPAGWKVPKEGDRRSELVKAGALILAEIERIDRAAARAAPDGVEAALTDAIVHGTGAFRVHGDGSTEHVDLQGTASTSDGNHQFDWKRDGATVTMENMRPAELSEEERRHYAKLAAFPPNLQRDALYQDYAVPKPASPEGEKP